MSQESVYWKINGGGFYLLESPEYGYVFVGHDEHRRLLDDAAINGKIIVFSEDLNSPVTKDQEIQENAE